MKKTKSILIFVLSALLTLSLAIFAACGGGTTSGSDGSGGSDTCEHKVTYVKPDISATCTTDGRGYLTCKDCGKKLSNEVTTIPAKGHNYVAGFCQNCKGEDPAHPNFYANAIDFTTLKTVNVSGQNIIANLLLGTLDENGEIISPEMLVKNIAIENGIVGATATDKEYFANIGIKAEGLANLTASLLVNDTLARAAVDKDGTVTNVRLDKSFIEELIKANAGDNQTGDNQQNFDPDQITQYIDLALGQLGTNKNKVLYNLSKYFFSAEEKTNEVVFTLDYDAIKRLNANLAAYSGKEFIDDLIGEKTFQTLSQAILSTISSPDLGLSDEEKQQITSIVNDLATKSVYELFATKDGKSANDIKKSVNDFIDKIKESLSVKIVSDKDGKIKSVAVTVANLNVTTIAKILYPEKNIQTALISGTITLTPSTETVSDDYADKIDELKNATDLGDNESKEADYTHETAETDGSEDDSTEEAAKPITTHYKIVNGNVVSVKTVYQFGEEYFSIECNRPLLVCSMIQQIDVGGDQPLTIKAISVLQFVTIPTGVAGDNGNDLLTASIKGDVTVRKATLGENGFVDGDVLEKIPVPSSALTRLQLISFTL